MNKYENRAFMIMNISIIFYRPLENCIMPECKHFSPVYLLYNSTLQNNAELELRSLIHLMYITWLPLISALENIHQFQNELE